MRRAGLLLLPLLAGCYAYVRPPDATPMTAFAGRAAPAGRLAFDRAGALTLGPALGDIEAALGVDLAPVDSGVVVAAVRSSTEPGFVVTLEPGDVILEVRPLAPWLPPDALPAAPGILVSDLDDLRGLALGLDGLALALRVRRQGVEVVVLQPLREPTLVATRAWAPALAARLGVELARLDDWPASRLPAGAAPEDYLVTRVALGGEGARLGLRPLDLVKNERGLFDLLTGNVPPEVLAYAEEHEAELSQRPVEVVPASGAPRQLLVALPSAPRDVGFMDIFNYQSNGARTHLGLLPFDLLFHYSSERHHDPRTDTFSTARRWSLLTFVQARTQSGGAEGFTSVRIDALLDEPRSSYLAERQTP